jgi:hypothetical protein
VGRHTAPDGDAVHPVVAAALARRAADTVGAHRDEAMQRFATQRIDGNVGWPGEPPGPGGGLGWPGEPAQDAASGTDLSAHPEDDLPEDDLAEHPGAPSLEPAGRRRGWRRLLGRAA